jgi:hypothetical protein
MNESRTSHLYARHRAAAPESKVARRAQLCVFTFTLGAGVTPAARRAGDYFFALFSSTIIVLLRQRLING